MAESAESVVRDFFEKEGGILVYISDDYGFTRALRNVVSRVIGLRGEVLQSFSSVNAAMDKCAELRDQDIPFVVFIERMLDNRPSTDSIIRIKREFPDARMIVLTWEATQETVAYFFELGVSRVLVKPASANKVVEELAGTISPPMELKQQIERCRELLAARDYEAALKSSDRILVVRPDSARALAMRGDALMGLGRVDQAVQAYMAAHEANPIFMAPLIKLAEAFRDMEDERALAYLKELDAISPLNPERKIDIAEQHLRQGQHEQAEQYLDQSMRAAERETRSMVGDLTERIVDAVSPVAPDLAVKYLSRVIDTKRVLGRDDLVHFNRLGIILRGEGRWAEAVDVYAKAVALAPEDPVLHYNMGLAHWEGHERMKALDCFEKGLGIDPNFYAGSVGAALNIGSLYLDLHYADEALPFFEHVLSLDPENELARAKLAKAEHLARTDPRPRRGQEPEPAGDTVFNLEELVAPSKKKKKKKKKRKPFTNLEI
ncbi:tetratricopeptide repeat protein [Pseudodesulfovibrio indicus]|uniref:Tetratricopeptide repeat protein n=1 Tax=Pseudodesulfovibrio indicus TaxID=1716143 RepID=A0AA94TIW3_9BACT|nr:tetratricopeptide repeat protein [Pseudodesulfovibrio indicus]TDT86272.1 tetratricopeptide repeat protein [Pseudodesulfovibrio indicus]